MKHFGRLAMNKKDPIIEVIKGLVHFISAFLRSLFWGSKAICKKKLQRFCFFFSLIVSVAVVFLKEKVFALSKVIYIQYALYYLLLLIPVFVVSFFGYIETAVIEKYYEIFKNIGFVGKDKKYPLLLSKQKLSDKVEILKFKSNIPLEDWKKNDARLETALDCSIQRIEQGNNKKIIILTTVGSQYKIPDKISWKDEYIKDKGIVVVGETALEQIAFDLNKNPHVLVAGETGSGKSVILRTILWQLINKAAHIVMIDFKGGVEFGKRYEEFGEVITERERAAEVLKFLVNENQERLKLFRELEVKNIEEFNEKTGKNLCRVGVIIDEIAEMLDKTGISKKERGLFDEMEASIASLARLARATGINLILGVQRPDANVLPGQIKNNIVVRICGRFADKPASEIVLGNTEACNLPELKGRFIFKLGNELKIFQAYYFDDDIHLHFVDLPNGELLTKQSKTNDFKTKFEKSDTAQQQKDIELDLNY